MKQIVYGKVGTSASAFQKAISGKKILDARQQGKYFWLVMESSPHPLMHFGMNGWIKFRNDDTVAYYRPKKADAEEWPPKYTKFNLQFKEDPKCEVAFVDSRRLARIRLVNAKAEDMRNTTPLKENGPDPIVDKDILTVQWLSQKLRSKKVPVKALLLDQGMSTRAAVEKECADTTIANISGIGNWVADEVMYQAKLHPEQYSNTFSDEQIQRLHKAIMYVCDTAVEHLAESDKFPEDWLMKHRWGKGKKGGSQLPNGAKITFLTVGGRTSAIVPSVQKKTAAVAGDVSEGAEDEDTGEEVKPKKGGKRKAAAAKEEEEVEEKPTRPKRARKAAIEEETSEDDDEVEEKPVVKKAKKAAPAKKGKKVQEEPEVEEDDGETEEKSKRVAKKATKAANGVAKKGKKAEQDEGKTEEPTERRRSGRISK